MHTIVIKKEGPLFIASFEDDPNAQGTGLTVKDAVGDLVLENLRTFNIGEIIPEYLQTPTQHV